MRYCLCIPLCLMAITLPAVCGTDWQSVLRAEEASFAPGAKLKVESGDGSGGEGPAWDSKLGLLTSGNGHIYRLDRDGKSSIYRKDAGTNGLLFEREGRLLACEPARHRITR